LASILNQTIKDLEIIVVNDGSTDGSEEIVDTIAKHEKRIKLIHQINSGVSSARNRGVKESTYDFITFLDADDEWETDHLKALVALRKRYPSAGLYVTDLKIIRQNRLLYTTSKVMQRHGIKKEIQMEVDFFDLTAKLGVLAHCTNIGVPKEIIEKAGYFNEMFINGQDGDLISKIALNHQVCFTSQGAAIWRLDGAELSQLSSVVSSSCAEYIPCKIERDNIAEQNKSFFLLAYSYLSVHPSLITFLWQSQFRIIDYYLKRGERKKAFLYAMRVHEYYGLFPRNKIRFIGQVLSRMCLALLPIKIYPTLKKMKDVILSLKHY
jgi:glycosyltransferase involved in cell wall biosynthesis